MRLFDKPKDQLITQLLKGSNYTIWRKAITNTFKSKHKIGFLDGSPPKPEERDLDKENWNNWNGMITLWILNLVNKDSHVVYYDTIPSIQCEKNWNIYISPRQWTKTARNQKKTLKHTPRKYKYLDILWQDEGALEITHCLLKVTQWRMFGLHM